MNESTVDAKGHWIGHVDEPKNAPELPTGRFGKSEPLGGNRVILAVRPTQNFQNIENIVTIESMR